MTLDYRFSQCPILAQQSATLDLLIRFTTPPTLIQKPRTPLNLSIVIDRSGSMAGQPLKQALKAAQQLLAKLTPSDTVSIVIYDDTVETIFPPQQLTTPENAYNALKRVQAGGCTNLSGGWLQGCEWVKTQSHCHAINRVLLLTDGIANVGVQAPDALIHAAQQQQQQGISTTTLGFGTHFNEDLLIGMAQAGGGNFYFIQSAEDMAGVFAIELDSLGSQAAKSLIIELQPAPEVAIQAVINDYPHEISQDHWRIMLGDVYAQEEKLLALQLQVMAGQVGTQILLNGQCRYQQLDADEIKNQIEPITISLPVGDLMAVSNTPPDKEAISQISRLRIAKAKASAVALADQGQFTAAATQLRTLLEHLRQTPLAETFEMAEEMDQLAYYAKQLDTQQFPNEIRKELRDQSYQSTRRNRSDLALRGISSGSAAQLEATTDAQCGVVLQCIRENGKLRMKVTSAGYNPDFNVQFPRDLREEGIRYIVEQVELASNGTFYRVNGTIRRLDTPGQPYVNRAQNQNRSARTTNPSAKPLSNQLTAADLETTDSVGQGVLVQCVAQGKKLRARVVSDGYNPDYNMMFPRSIRELGVLYVVDEVRENPKGGSYIAYGKIRRLKQ